MNMGRCKDCMLPILLCTCGEEDDDSGKKQDRRQKLTNQVNRKPK